MLEAAGLSRREERAYRYLVSTYEGTLAEIARHLGTEPSEADAVLESLRGKGLVNRVTGPPSHFVPNPPDVALGPHLLRTQESLEGARGAVAALTEEYRGSVRRRDADQLVEILTGATSIRRQLHQLQTSAQHEMVWFCRAGHVAMPSSDNHEEFEALAAGVHYRVIYEQALLEEPGMIDSVAASVRQGEEARTLESLPVRLAIADGAIALCPLVQAADGQGEPTAALIRESSLLSACIALFESYWWRASPLRLGQPAGAHLTGDERSLLSLLVGGVTDKAIATQLGISQRTVQRRIYDLMHRTNTRTRVQLAWQAARSGWLA